MRDRNLITRDSHYVPIAVLRRWSDDGVHVLAYRTLVSTAAVPAWKRRAIRGLAYQRDLYTVFTGSQEHDEMERWIKTTFEDPGLAAISRVVSGSLMSVEDWRHLAMFVAAQDVRTPLNFVESMKRWHHQVPEVLHSTIKEGIQRLEHAKAQGIRLAPRPAAANEFSRLVRVSLERRQDATTEGGFVRAEVTLGREWWLASIRHLLTGVAGALCKHRWSVGLASGEAEWPLTDHPVLRLNYYKPGSYDFGGGWGNPGSEIIMPLSPKHLLYVQVGAEAPNRFVFTPDQTHLLQRLLVERAHRWVFARTPASWVESVRPRVVDAEAFAAETSGWKQWHVNQSRSEQRPP